MDSEHFDLYLFNVRHSDRCAKVPDIDYEQCSEIIDKWKLIDGCYCFMVPINDNSATDRYKEYTKTLYTYDGITKWFSDNYGF